MNFKLCTLLVGGAFLAFANLACATYMGDHKVSDPEKLSYENYEKNRGMGLLRTPDNHNSHLIVTVHGGGWSSRSYKDIENVARSLSSHGYITYNINYRLAPKFKHPAPAEDLGKALSHVLSHLYDKGIEVKKIGLWGYSSGAHTVTYYTLKYSKEHPELPQVDVVVAGGSPMDITWYTRSPYTKKYIGFYRDEDIDAYIEASPTFHISPESPPFFLYHAVKDRLVEHGQTASFQTHLIQNGVENKRYDIEFWGHMNAFMFSGKAIKEGVHFLNETLKP